MILCISKVCGSRCGATEILTTIIVQKWQFLAISEIWTNILACCSCKLIINYECLVYVYSLEFPLIIYLTEIGHFYAVRGPSSLHISISQGFSYLVDTMSLSFLGGVPLIHWRVYVLFWIPHSSPVKADVCLFLRHPVSKMGSETSPQFI